MILTDTTIVLRSNKEWEWFTGKIIRIRLLHARLYYTIEKEQSQKFNIRCHAIISLFLFVIKQINENIKIDCQKKIFVSLQKNKSYKIYQ